ncbi:hypothetical protein AVEN_199012-1 [Araneus ventricosus]|uniref:Uncharacterized protein n=1 Tax=Araneus ventricosus TaxID=182803 RepID=A0A4Y2LK11_ARAVE|nr:hypothetical protein AVEN_199012-1 [Araneus ventricosus]
MQKPRDYQGARKLLEPSVPGNMIPQVPCKIRFSWFQFRAYQYHTALFGTPEPEKNSSRLLIHFSQPSPPNMEFLFAPPGSGSSISFPSLDNGTRTFNSSLPGLVSPCMGKILEFSPPPGLFGIFLKGTANVFMTLIDLYRHSVAALCVKSFLFTVSLVFVSGATPAVCRQPPRGPGTLFSCRSGTPLGRKPYRPLKNV